EDGIRDFHVTGVQTCALPICSDDDGTRRDDLDADADDRVVAATLDRLALVNLFRALEHTPTTSAAAAAAAAAADPAAVERRFKRSEERRVGKERRAGWSPPHE